MSRSRLLAASSLLAGVAVMSAAGCGDDGDGSSGSGGGAGSSGSAGAGGDPPFVCDAPDVPAPAQTAEDARPQCSDFEPLRNAYFGDLHVHTRLSFDAYADDVRITPAQAYDFARGQPLDVPPLDGDGNGTQTIQLAQPLDFAAVTDHAEFLGEIRTCITPGSPGYDSETCVSYRTGGAQAILDIARVLANVDPKRRADLCGEDGTGCDEAALTAWREIRDAAEAAYDRTDACSFTSMIGYEWTGNTNTSNLHRNVLFRDERVPDRTTSYFEAPQPEALWQRLDCDCPRSIEGCSVLAIPHNPNLSNGKMFAPEYPGAEGEQEQRSAAEFRARLEPLVEIFQHKGSSECFNGASGILGMPDELCDIEQMRPGGDDCGDGQGSLGIINGGCTSRNDFVRGALLTGLREQRRIGANPFRLGIIASTDTHLGAPGSVSEADYVGHTGAEAAIENRLQSITQPPSGVVGNPGGLVGVWAEQNTRHAIFDALARRETFGTSGPRIVPRFFGAWQLADDVCADADLVATADAAGVPMGGVLPERTGDGAPVFVVTALRDASATAGQLAAIQIVKGWLDGDDARYRVFDVAGSVDNGASVDEATCQTSGPGSDSLCGRWVDPEFDAAEPAFYYVRVVENPSCRWSWRQCSSLPEASRPPSCADPSVPRTVRELAWTSPIWYSP